MVLQPGIALLQGRLRLFEVIIFLQELPQIASFFLNVLSGIKKGCLRILSISRSSCIAQIASLDFMVWTSLIHSTGDEPRVRRTFRLSSLYFLYCLAAIMMTCHIIFVHVLRWLKHRLLDWGKALIVHVLCISEIFDSRVSIDLELVLTLFALS